MIQKIKALYLAVFEILATLKSINARLGQIERSQIEISKCVSIDFTRTHQNYLRTAKYD